MTYKRILIRESKTPFDNVWTGPIPPAAYRRVYNAHHRDGTKNFGNLMFGHAAYKELSAPGVQLDIDHYRVSGTDDFDREVDRINAEYDAFVLPLDNAFRHEFKGHLLLRRMTKTVQKLKIPCVVVGVGAQFDLDPNFETLKDMEADAKAFVGAVMDRSESMAVRGQITKDWLVSLGFDQDRIIVIGCPSIYYHGENLKVTKGPLDKVAFNYTPQTKDPRVLPFTDYYNRHPEGVTYVTQERDLMNVFAEGRNPDPNSENSLKNPVPRLTTPEKTAFLCDIVPWMDFLKTQSFAIGTRIHGNIVAILAGTPGHVIVHDSRTLEMVQHLDIPYTTYAQLEGFDGREAYERSDYTAMMKNHPARLAEYARFLERNKLAHILYDQAELLTYDAKVRRSIAEAKLPGVFEHHPLVRKVQNKVKKLIGA